MFSNELLHNEEMKSDHWRIHPGPSYHLVSFKNMSQHRQPPQIGEADSRIQEFTFLRDLPGRPAMKWDGFQIGHFRRKNK